MKIGYARVSTSDQRLDGQIDDLKKVGCQQIVTEKESSSTDRPKLEEALQWLREGDVLICTRMDRLARSIQNLIDVMQRLQEKNVEVIFLDQNLDTASAGGRLIFHVFAAVAEFERDLIRERTKKGLQAARQRGRLGGRKKVLTGTKLKAFYEMYDSKQLSMAQISETIGVNKRTLYDYLKRRDADAIV
ncbi:MAG: recombinase family protein [SAR324 cluster bacterium]|nr:recombinase family protein [SAR324 cluster bacterium]